MSALPPPRGCEWSQPSHLELGQRGHHVLPVAIKLAAGVAHQEELRQVAVVPQTRHTAQTTHKVHSQVQLLEALAVCRREVDGVGITGSLRQITLFSAHSTRHTPSSPSRFSMSSMLFRARFKYSSFFSRPTFSDRHKRHTELPKGAQDGDCKCEVRMVPQRRRRRQRSLRGK